MKRLGEGFIGVSISQGVVFDSNILLKRFDNFIREIIDLIVEDVDEKHKILMMVQSGVWVSVEEAIDHRGISDIDAEVNEDIWGFLNEIAPRGCYFGASPNDEALIGFWVKPKEKVPDNVLKDNGTF